jgi:hypothetical protein
MKLPKILKNVYQDCFRKWQRQWSDESMQEGCTLKAIRLTQLQAHPKKNIDK